MGILTKIKSMLFGNEEVSEVENKVEVQDTPVVEATHEEVGTPTGEFCSYEKCKKELLSTDKIRELKGFKFHKSCAKKVIKEAKTQMGL
jgi:hypothetical protein